MSGTVTRDSNPTKFLLVIVYRLAFNGLQYQNNRLSVIVFAVIVGLYSISYIVYRYIGYQLAVVVNGLGRVYMYILGVLVWQKLGLM